MSELPHSEKVALEKIHSIFGKKAPFVGLVLVVLFGIVSVNMVSEFRNPVCSYIFEGSEKREAKFKKWLGNFYEENPNASTDDAIESRRNFLAENCGTSLQITTDKKVGGEIAEAERAIREKIFGNQVKPICPDDFKDSNEKIASFSEWVKEFTEKYPNATDSDLSRARKSFYIENNCTEALKRYEDYIAGNVDKKTKQMIEGVIKEAILKKQINPICPSDIEDSKERTGRFTYWLGEFEHKNPNASIKETAEARKDFYIKYNCTGELKKYNDYIAGNIDGELKNNEEITLNSKLLELMQAKKYRELITLSEKELGNYSDNIFALIQTSMAYCYLGDKAIASAYAYYTDTVIFKDNEFFEQAILTKGLYSFILNSDICKID